VDFVKHGENITNPRATHLCLIIVKLHFARNSDNFSTYPKHIPSPKTEAGQQHLAQFNNKKTKIAQFENRQIHRTSVLLCSQDQSVSKRNMAVHSLSTLTPAPSGRRRYPPVLL
jgi:hypothetical protein